MGVQKDCVFWNVTNKGWSTNGCTTIQNIEDMTRVKCECNHLTNFAVFMNVQAPTQDHQLILSVITLVGQSFSLIGSAVTFAWRLFRPELRRSLPPKILMNLCLAVLLFNITFLVGADNKTRNLPCEPVSMLLQYFFLSMIFWNVVEVIHALKGFVFTMKSISSNFLRNALVFAWGTPGVFVSIGIGLGLENYQGEIGCMVSGT